MANAAHVEITLFNLSRVDLKPGDVMVYRHPKQVDAASIASIKKQLADVFPGHQVCVVDGGAELAVLRPVE